MWVLNRVTIIRAKVQIPECVPHIYQRKRGTFIWNILCHELDLNQHFFSCSKRQSRSEWKGLQKERKKERRGRERTGRWRLLMGLLAYQAWHPLINRTDCTQPKTVFYSFVGKDVDWLVPWGGGWSWDNLSLSSLFSLCSWLNSFLSDLSMSFPA